MRSFHNNKNKSN